LLQMPSPLFPLRRPHPSPRARWSRGAQRRIAPYQDLSQMFAVSLRSFVPAAFLQQSRHLPLAHGIPPRQSPATPQLRLQAAPSKRVPLPGAAFCRSWEVKGSLPNSMIRPSPSLRRLGSTLHSSIRRYVRKLQKRESPIWDSLGHGRDLKRTRSPRSAQSEYRRGRHLAAPSPERGPARSRGFGAERGCR
jgi:hypothetical protein